jgi:hypothetical protein
VLADLVLVAHLAFVAFALFGGLLALRWRWIPWLHLPALAWGVLVELAGWLCPLTPLEVRLREAAGSAGYSGGFVEHYLLPLLYPTALSREGQVLLGVGLLAVNLAVYAVVLSRRSAEKLNS